MIIVPFFVLGIIVLFSYLLSKLIGKKLVLMGNSNAQLWRILSFIGLFLLMLSLAVFIFFSTFMFER